jgi:hypothetical protein
LPSPEPAFPRLAAAQGAGFLAVALLGLGFQLWLPRVLPQPGDDRAVAEVLATEARPGDVVLVHPWWTERARLFLPPGVPLVGYLGDEGDPLDEHPRVWVLSQPRLPFTPESGFWRAFLPGRTELAAERRLGPYRLGLYSNGRARPVLLSAAEALGAASAEVDLPGQGPVACVHEGEGFRCPGGARVEASLHEVLYQPARCLFIVPPGGPGSVEVTLPGVPPAARLRFEAAIVWEHAWKHGPHLTPLNAQLSDATTGTPLATLVVSPGTEGFVATEVPGGPDRLRLRVRSDNAHERETCIRLRALGPGKESR